MLKVYCRKRDFKLTQRKLEMVVSKCYCSTTANPGILCFDQSYNTRLSLSRKNNIIKKILEGKHGWKKIRNV